MLRTDLELDRGRREVRSGGQIIRGEVKICRVLGIGKIIYENSKITNIKRRGIVENQQQIRS